MKTLKNVIGRRSFLKGAAAAPAVASAVAQHTAAQAQNLALGGGQGGVAQPFANRPTNFVSFIKWFQDVGEAAIRAEARVFQTVDADIIEMRLPLATKVRMQRARNYKRLLAERRTWFDRTLNREGKVEYWL